ncbi:nuclear pore complex protein Nup133 isoform X2 [Neocloeon triangulifer]|uniref:nuclear pore complex protein Nup133 isoform X2 n=1 Tax=Neocloeon triangulifer TaxID=2078957 RepID=UPI00286F6E40|nr:nuclear pore complex protein Nup133 isoform X2 [Neocloeon triangulifer]
MDISTKSLNISNLSHLGGKTPRSAARRSVLGLPSANRSTRGSVSGRSTQSAMVICRTPYHVVESFGSSLPVMVTEAIAYADRSTVVSVELSKSGWAWLVSGRRLLVWQYRQDGQSKWTSVSQCRELTLPPSDLAHRAQLVTVFSHKKASVPSCIAVSPEGAVRYWASVAHEGSWIEENADLLGQECDSLSGITPVGCVLATTTSTLCLLSPVVVNGRHQIVCKTLRSSQGWLGGISRRMSSIIWGSMPAAQTSETRLVKVMTQSGTSAGDTECKLLVLAGLTLQKWVLSNKDIEKLVFEFDMSRLLKSSFSNDFWEQSNTSAQDLSIWLLDMEKMENGVLILAAAANLNVSPQIHYAAVLVASENDKAPESFQMFCPFLKFNGFHQGEDSECEDLNYRFVVFGSSAFIYNKKVIMAVPVTINDPGADVDRLDFPSAPGDAILTGNVYRTTPVFFSRIHGVISVTETDVSPLDVMNSSIYSESIASERAPFTSHTSLAQSSFQPFESFRECNFSDGSNNSGPSAEELTPQAVCISKLKKAFVLYNRRELAACKDILDTIVPNTVAERGVEVNAPLDLVIVHVSKDIINDMPASDPRWSETHSSATFGTSSSLQVQQQLQGKQQTLELYVNFLKAVDIWNKLSAITARGVVIATSLALQEHAEKVAAALTLRSLHASHADLLDKAIKATLKPKNSRAVPAALTHIDLFFREVSEVHQVLITLGMWSQEIVHSNKSPAEVVASLQEVNHIVLETLQEIADFRKHHRSMFGSESVFASDLIEYLPWTASSHDEGLRNVLSDLLSRNFQYAARQCSGDQMTYSTLCVELMNLADLLLEGYSSHLESLKGSEKFDLLVHQYELQRRKIIQPFVDESMIEQAMKLAEKYHDFNTLVQICESAHNQERLESYIQKFADEGFSEYLFGWYMKEDKQDKLMNLFGGNVRPMQHQQALVSFLSQHPQLAWLQAIRTGNYSSASGTLYQLAEEQTEKLARKKTMLSLAKLTALASDEPEHKMIEHVRDVDMLLDLCSYQESLPQSLVDFLNQDLDNMAVLTPINLIKLYISEENKEANAFDYKKALDLLAFVPNDSDKEDLCESIWCQAILRNDWESVNLDYPMETCKNLIFCQLFDLLNISGQMDLVLPAEQLLSSSKLGSLVESKPFKYIIKYFYEHVATSTEC